MNLFRWFFRDYSMTKRSFVVFLSIGTALLIGCEQQEIVEPEIQEEVPTIVLLHESTHLQGLVRDFSLSITPINGRSHSLVDDVDFERAIKSINPETGVTHYSFLMSSEDGLILRRFILSENSEGEIFGHVFEYEVDADWYAQQDSFPGLHQYHGYFRVIDLDRNVLAENVMVEGSSVSEESIGGRTSGRVCVSRVVRICKSVPSMPEIGEHCYYDTFTDCFSTDGGGGIDFQEYDRYNEQSVSVERGPTTLPTDGNGGGSGLPPPPKPQCPSGQVKDMNGNCVKKPCVSSTKANPLKNMQVLGTRWNGIVGGLYGYGRGTGKIHNGIDFDAPVGTPVHAMFTGRVDNVNTSHIQGEDWDRDHRSWPAIRTNAAGNRIYIAFRLPNNSNNYRTGFWHLSRVANNPATGRPYRVGDRITQGTIVGYTGSTGNANGEDSAGPHLHLAAYKNGADYNPEYLLKSTINRTTGAGSPCN